MSGALSSIKSKASAGLNKAANAVGIERNNASRDSMEEVAEMCPELTYQQRMIGFCTCFLVGYLITFSSFNYFVDLIEGRPIPFVMIYTVSILSLLH